MKRQSNDGFDEVLIVNPSDPASAHNQRVRLMRFNNYGAPEMGYYAEAPDNYGYYGEPQEGYGYYAEDPSAAGNYGYAEAEPYGYYAAAPQMMGGWSSAPPAAAQYGGYAPAGYGEYEPVGYYAEEQPLGYYAEPGADLGQYGEYLPYGGGYGEADPLGYYGQEMGYYGAAPEMVGYGEEPYLSEADYAGMGYYGEPDMGGYVREMAPRFNPGCPIPTNINGFEEAERIDGYTRPTMVNPTCKDITPQPGGEASLPDSFKPHW